MRAGIALGSNLGDRLASLRAAAWEVRCVSGVGEPIRCSQVYETEPVGTEPSAAAFLNAVVEVEFEGLPKELLQALQAIEGRMGRPPARARNASRTIDLDLLYAGKTVMNELGCVLPHPRLHLRRFVLQPLADLRPELLLPGQSRSVAELLAALPDTALVETRRETLS